MWQRTGQVIGKDGGKNSKADSFAASANVNMPTVNAGYSIAHYGTEEDVAFPCQSVDPLWPWRDKENKTSSCSSLEGQG